LNIRIDQNQFIEKGQHDLRLIDHETISGIQQRAARRRVSHFFACEYYSSFDTFTFLWFVQGASKIFIQPENSLS